MAPRLVVFLLGYAVFGTWLTAAGFGRRLMRLHYAILKREGDLRFDLVRVRENAGKDLLNVQFILQYRTAQLIQCAG